MRLFEGWRLLAVLSMATLAVPAMIVIAEGVDMSSMGAVIRATARTSLSFFLLAITASAVHALWPSPLTAWQRRNRRYFGLSFAFSHAVHAVAIIVYSNIGGAEAALSPVMLIFGGIGYTFIVAMAVTSFDSTAAFVGPRLWNGLHTAGVYYLWVQFMVSFGMRLPGMPGYAGFLALLVGAMILRLVARRRRLRPMAMPA